MRKTMLYVATIPCLMLFFGCSNVPLDDGTNIYKVPKYQAKTNNHNDDGTNLYINQVITTSSPKYALSTKQNTKSSTRNSQSSAVSTTASSSSGKNTKNYVPPKVIVPTESKDAFIYPINNPKVSQIKNGGISFAVPANTNVLASAPGVVIFAGSRQSFGNAIFVYNDNNFITIYYFLDKILVHKGDYISDLNKPIATANDNFHFEIRQKTDSGISVINAQKILKPRPTP